MSGEKTDSQQLKAGEHYGHVSRKLHLSSAIVSESVYQKSVALPRHSHELAFFTLIIEGHYSEQTGGKNLLYAPMTVLWRQADIAHRDKIERNGSRFFFVEIKRDCFNKLLTYENVPEHFFSRGGPLVWLAWRLRDEIRRENFFSPLVAEGITLEMLGSLTRKNAAGLEKRAPRWLARVVEKLNEEFAENLSNEELAAEAGVHPVHLAAVFRRFFHRNIGEYVQQRRVDYVSTLLGGRDLPLAEIACAAGFSDQSHLTRVFKRLTGTTPGAFRRALD